MRALLSAHPRIAIPPETHFLNRFAAEVDDFDLRTADRFLGFWKKFAASDRFIDLGIDGDALRERILVRGDFHLRTVFALTLQEYARAAGKPRWGEKTPAHDRHVGILFEWFPQARVIFMVRDPRAACASLLQAPWRTSGVSGAPHNKPGRVRRLQLLYEDSCFWNHSVERGRQWQSDARVILVRYEDLAGRPETTLRSVCRFIDEEFHPHMLERRSEEALPSPRAQLSDREHQEWRRAHIERARQDVSTDSVAKWRSDLTPLEVAVIEATCQRLMREFGYESGTPDQSYLQAMKGRLSRGVVVLLLGLRKRFGTETAA